MYTKGGTGVPEICVTPQKAPGICVIPLDVPDISVTPPQRILRHEKSIGLHAYDASMTRHQY